MINNTGKVVDENGDLVKQDLINFPNNAKPVEGEVVVIKNDDNKQPLEGAVFGIYKDDVLVQEGTTVLQDGVAKYTFTNLLPGTYTLKEIKAPNGYITSLVEHTIIVPFVANEAMLKDKNYTITDTSIIRNYYVTYANTLFEINVFKGDEILSNIPTTDAINYVNNNVGYSYRIVGNGIASVYMVLEGVTFNLFKVNEDNSRTLIGTYTSSTEGLVDFTGYLFEEKTKYELIEKTTLPGYILDTRPIVIDTGSEAMLSTFNGIIEKYKNNQPIKGRIIISKYDEDEKTILPGATFGLYTFNDLENPIKTSVTNSSGVIEFRDLELGSYIVKELNAPEGYQLLSIVKEIILDNQLRSISLIINNPKLISISVNKQWVGEQKESVTIRLLANNEVAFDKDGNEIQEVILSNNNLWKTEFINLPKYDKDNNLIDYTVIEDKIDGYNQLITGTVNDGFVITNTKEELLSIGVTKVWVGDKGNSVTINLLSNNKLFIYKYLP